MRSLLALPLMVLGWPAARFQGLMDDVDGVWSLDDPLLTGDRECAPWPR